MGPAEGSPRSLTAYWRRWRFRDGRALHSHGPDLRQWEGSQRMLSPALETSMEKPPGLQCYSSAVPWGLKGALLQWPLLCLLGGGGGRAGWGRMGPSLRGV